jgi:hypothetical protein
MVSLLAFWQMADCEVQTRHLQSSLPVAMGDTIPAVYASVLTYRLGSLILNQAPYSHQNRRQSDSRMAFSNSIQQNTSMFNISRWWFHCQPIFYISPLLYSLVIYKYNVLFPTQVKTPFTSRILLLSFYSFSSAIVTHYSTKVIYSRCCMKFYVL